MKILIVDDVAVMRRLLERALEGFGSIDMADSGVQALAMLKTALDAQRPYDLMCLDIVMPDIDGIQVLQHLREMEAARGIADDSRTRVMIISAVSKSDTVRKAMQHGCDGFLLKPCSIEKARAEFQRIRLA